VCCFSYILNIIITSNVYSKFFKKSENITKNIKNVCILWIAKFVTASIKAKLEEHIIPNFLSFLRHQMFIDYINANQVIFDDTNVTSDVRDILDLTRLVRDLFVWFCQILFPTFIFLVFMNVYFINYYPIVGALTFVSSIINVYVCHTNYKEMVEDMYDKYKVYKRIGDKFEENLNNLMNIFLNGKVDYCISENRKIENEYLPVAISQHRKIKSISSYLRINTYVTSSISLYLLYKNTNMEDFINCLFIYTFYISTLETLFEDLPNNLHLYAQLKMSEKALVKKIFYKLENKCPVFPKQLQSFKGAIEFRDIVFSYQNTKDTEKTIILNHLNWMIYPGEKIALVSKSGSGKTTTMKLLLKFYEPQEGQILLDGMDIKQLDAEEIREKINYINQKTILFNDTIINNMKFGNDRTDEEIVSLLAYYDLLTIFRDCDRSPDTCLYTMVETNGTNMSLGMQKIIFLIRGLLKENSQVIILDEPLSSVDPNSREKIMRMITDLTVGKTVIIITHDDMSKIVDKTISLSQIQI
jgi:ABC-type multidrug transport system fused ATPase/permease subunit